MPATSRASPRSAHSRHLPAATLIAAYFDATKGGASRPLHDPCVPLLALRPDLFTTETLSVSVNRDEGDLAGAIEDGPHAIAIAMGVETSAVLDLLAETLG